MTKVLVVGPSWVGDMVMAQSLLKLLAKQGAQIDVLAPAWNFALLDRMDEVHQAIAMPVGHGQVGLKARYHLGKSLKDQGYDQAIVLPNSFKSALVPYFAGILKRTGWRGEMRYGVLNDIRVLDKKRLPLMVQRFAALAYDKDHAYDLNDYPYPKMTVQPKAVKKAMVDHGLKVGSKDRVLALCPGAAFGQTKQWPAAYYAEVAKQKLKEGWQVWLFGSNKDAETSCRPIQESIGHRAFDLSGKVKLNEAVDLLSRADMVVSNDSGLLHVSCALERPLVAIYGSTTADFTPPLGDQVKVLNTDIACRPCFQRECRFKHLKCLYDIHPSQVLSAMQALLEV